MSRGSIGAPGFSTVSRAIRIASRARDPGASSLVHVAAHVEVVDDLAEQVADVLDQHRVRLQVAGDAEPAEHLLAEAVGGGDRRRVEVRQRAHEPRAPVLDDLRRPVGEQPHDGIARTASPTRASSRSALTSRSRTRSRSSPVAIRVNVTSSSRSSGMPSAT